MSGNRVYPRHNSPTLIRICAVAGALLAIQVLSYATPVSLPTQQNLTTQTDSEQFFEVTTLDDSLAPDDGVTSLREALTSAFVSAGPNVITFAPRLFTSPQTITLTSALPELTTHTTIQGPGANLLTVSGNHQFIVFQVKGQTTVSIRSLTISNGNSGLGGGIANQGTLTVQSCELTNNQAYYGGALFNDYTTPSQATFIDSTFSGNMTTRTGGGSQFGGAIFNGATLKAYNCTFSENSSEFGSAITTSGGTTFLSNCTVVGNTSAGAAITGYGLTLDNSLIGGNTNGNEYGDVYSLEAVKGDYNLISNPAEIVFTGTHNLLGVSDLRLGPLSNNGGPTHTMALLDGSPAIDAGDPAFDTGTRSFDQRGEPFLRKSGAAIDIGAYELRQSDDVIAPTVTVGAPADGAHFK